MPPRNAICMFHMIVSKYESSFRNRATFHSCGAVLIVRGVVIPSSLGAMRATVGYCSLGLIVLAVLEARVWFHPGTVQ
jgi:hypothetical protein